MTTIPKWLARIIRGTGRRCLNPSYRVALEYQLALRSKARYQFARLREFGPNRGKAIDIGANIGVFTYALSKLYPIVEAFEINPYLIENLRKSFPSRVHLHQVGLSNRKSESTFYLPILRGRPLLGWGSLETSATGIGDSHEEIQVSVTTLDSFAFEDIGFIKIDVEGHELLTLEGAKETIARCRPDVLIEIQDSNVEAVRSFFASRGYREIDLAPYTSDGIVYGDYLFKA